MRPDLRQQLAVRGVVGVKEYAAMEVWHLAMADGSTVSLDLEPGTANVEVLRRFDRVIGQRISAAEDRLRAAIARAR